MVRKGAKYLIVPSRSGSASKIAAEVVEELTTQGAIIATPRCDVSRADSFQQVLQECSKTMPPIKGCINAAAVLNVSARY